MWRCVAFANYVEMCGGLQATKTHGIKKRGERYRPPPIYKQLIQNNYAVTMQLVCDSAPGIPFAKPIDFVLKNTLVPAAGIEPKTAI